MAYFKKDGGNKFGGGNSFRGGDKNRGGFKERGNFNRSSDFERKEMFDTVCDECGKDCQVPFKPTGDRPVYCSNCFREREEKGNNDDRGNRRFDNDRQPARRFEDSRPAERNFEKPAVQSHEISKIMDQLTSMNSKIEKLLRLIESQSVKESAQVEKAVSAEVVEVPKARAKRVAAKKKKAE